MKSFTSLHLYILLLICSAAFAAPMTYDMTENPYSQQDPLPGGWTHELGIDFPGLGISFPADELIAASCEVTTLVSCPARYNPQGTSNILITMTNLSGIDWYGVTYVADPETTITNDDLQYVNGQQAFLIDYTGINTPLVYESMNADAVFEKGETWQFIIQNYHNSNELLADAFTSWDSANGTGLVGDQSGGDFISSGSIIAIPEPATLILLGLGSIVIRRKK